jgi:hypothetical protein
MRLTTPMESVGWLGGSGYQVIDEREEISVKEYIVRLRYLSEDTIRVQAHTAAEAIHRAEGTIGAADDTLDEGIIESSEVLHYYKPMVRVNRW